MSNLAVSATTTPYAVARSTTGSSSSTTVSSTSSATPKTVTSSTTPSSSTTANQTVSVATSSNTATLSSSTTYAYGSSASNSISRMVSSSTTPNVTSSSTTPSVSSSSTTLPYGTLERNGGVITILTSSSTTPSVTSSSTTPQASSSSTTLPYGTLERNGGVITILTSSSTTPSMTSSSTTPTNSSSTTPQISSGIPQVDDEYIANYYADKYIPSTMCEVLKIEKPDPDIMEKLNSLEEYSYEDTRDLFSTVRDRYSDDISEFFDTAGEIGIEFSANAEIPIAEFTVPNASAKLYIEIGANNASDISLLTIENSITEFSEEILDVDNFVNLFASTGANGKSVGLNSDNEAIISYEKDGFEISINKSKLQQGVFQMSVEKSMEVEDGSFTIGLELEFRPNDNFYGQVETIAANLKNDSYKDYAKDNWTQFNPIEHLFIQNGFFETSNFFERFVDVWAGTPSISRKIEQSIGDSVEEKMNDISAED